MGNIGWDTIMARARAAVRDLPVSPPFSAVFPPVGLGVMATLWPERPDAAGAILLHAPASVPTDIRPGTPVQLHIADGDPFAPADQVAVFNKSAARANAAVTLYTYARGGHFFTDFQLPEYDQEAADRAWHRVGVLLESLR